MTLAEKLAVMKDDFESNTLQVALAPQKRRTNEGGCIRIVISKNALWYQRFCAQFSSSRKRNRRKHDTAIRRKNTERALTLLVALVRPEDTPETLLYRVRLVSRAGIYAARLVDFAASLRVYPVKPSALLRMTDAEVKALMKRIENGGPF